MLIRKKKLIFSLIFFLLLFVVGKSRHGIFLQGYGDNVTYVETSINIKETGNSFSHFLFSAIDYQKSLFFNGIAEQITDDMFDAPDYSHRNSYKFHLTPFQHFISFFLYFFNAEIVWSFLTALSFLAIIFLLYYYLRKQSIPISTCIFFLLLLMSHPAWSYSLYGQLYIDRFYLLFGSLLIYSVHEKKDVRLILLWTLFCALLVEKIVIITSIFFISYLLLYWKRISKERKILFAILSLSLALFGFWTIKFYLDNHYYSSFLSFNQILNAHKIIFFPDKNLIIFYLFNLIPLLLIGIYEFRLMMITFIIMGPNIIGTLGGAEKSGWSTHYHSIYIPFLFFTLTLAFVKIFRRRKILYINSILLSFTIALLFLNPFNLEFNSNQYKETAIFRTVDSFIDYWNEDGQYQSLRKKKENFQKVIPVGSMISSPEFVSVFIFENRKLFVYPLGIKEADYVIVNPCPKSDKIPDEKSPIYCGIFSIANKEENSKIEFLINQKLKEYKYDLENPILKIDNWVVLKRLKNKP